MMVEVVVLDKRARKSKAFIFKKAEQLAKFLRLNGYLEIYLVGDKQMKKNILSYLAPKTFPRPDLSEEPLGEIYLNPSFIKKNKENLLAMLVHGILHIAGYNHKKKSDRIKMEKREEKIYSKFKDC